MKNFQMLSTTTYSDIEEYFRSALYDEVWKRDNPKETITFVYTVGEYGAGYRDWETDRKSTRLNSSHSAKSRMPSSA